MANETVIYTSSIQKIVLAVRTFLRYASERSEEAIDWLYLRM